jgi:hypothetical protein
LITAVMSFMHLSPLTPFNRAASNTTCAYYCHEQCSFHARPAGPMDQ